MQANGEELVDSSDCSSRSLFLTRAGQALVTGKYHKARPYSVEAVLLYAVCKYMQKEDPDSDAWMIMGISARLAVRLGYHRDPRHFTRISPFEGEMRRRTFFIVESLELLLSSQAGLPAIIHEEECDTGLPSNLFDADFDEDCKVLPLSRPPTEPTPMLYYRTKGRLAKIFRRVNRYALSCTAPSYQDTLKLDHELHEAHKEVPPYLQMRPLHCSISDEAYVVLHRLNIDLVYLMSLCLLHRNYLSQERSNRKFNYFRKTCTYAALQILDYQAEIHFACQPGGRFENAKWMLSSLTLQYFLLAAMIICLDLYESRNSSNTFSPEVSTAEAKKYDALRLSQEIWTSRRAISRDARRASNVLAAMLSKVPRPNTQSIPVKASQEVSNMSQVAMNGDDVLGIDSNSSIMSSWDTNGIDTQGQEFPTDSATAFDVRSIDPLDTIFNDPNDIDWVSLRSRKF